MIMTGFFSFALCAFTFGCAIAYYWKAKGMDEARQRVGLKANRHVDRVVLVILIGIALAMFFIGVTEVWS